MALFRKLATLATAAEAARRYAKKNPDKASQYIDKAAQFVDKQTKGKYASQISGVTQKAKGLAGVRETPGYGPGPSGNGSTSGVSDIADAPAYGQPVPRKPSPGPAQP